MSYPKTLHSGSYWQDFHRRRHLQHERRACFETTTDGDFLTPGAHENGVAYTFTSQRSSPYLTVIQNNGRLLTFPTGPVDMPPLPPPKPRKAPVISAARARAQAILDARPNPDDELLARLHAGPTVRKRKASMEDEGRTHKRWANSSGAFRLD
jgi:hypothetical protein